MKHRRKLRFCSLPALMLCSLIGCYLLLWVRLSESPVVPPSNGTPIDDISPKGKPLSPDRKVTPYIVPDSKRGTTLIAAFCNYHFRSVGVTWYQRMSQLGYSNHLLVATDQGMVDYLARGSAIPDVRYHIWIHEPMPKEVYSRRKPKHDHAYLELLMAVRWKYILEQLDKHGMHVVLTDVDNIFSRYIDVEKEITNKDPGVDVWHAYATKFPQKAFAQQGFVVCSGMSWWRSSPGGIKFAKLMQETCGDMCDDQRELNNLLNASPRLNMTWRWTDEARQSRLTNETTNDLRFLGLPTIGISGRSDVTGHTARIWDRDFAFRGPLYPDPCPPNNWVSMPILEAKSRQSAWKTKIESFAQWDEHCGKQTS